ncbi:MAG: toxin [Anaerolineae bacterium]|nr:toxin [Anaerolineae bacterium]
MFPQPAGPASQPPPARASDQPARPDPRFTLPAVSLPQGGGAIRSVEERLEVSATNGAASFQVPLPLAAGRGGFQPTLSLAYNSGAGNGPFGLGWSVEIPSISRKTERELPQYDDAHASDTFVLTGLDDLVPALDGDGDPIESARDDESGAPHLVRRYHPRIEGGFARIERWEHAQTGEVHWRSATPQNVTSVFGRTPAARVSDPADPARVFRWLLELSYDDRGNCIRYEHKAEDLIGVGSAPGEQHRLDGRAGVGGRYLKRVLYGNRTPYAFGAALPGADDFLFQLVFDYGEHDHAEPLVELGDGRFRYDADPQPDDAGAWSVRPDPFSWYRAGFDLRVYRRCRRVLLFHHFEALDLVRTLDLTYDDAPGFSLLIAITARGYMRNGAGYTCRMLPPMAFAYQPHAWDDTVRALDPGEIPAGIDGRDAQLVDLFGEGLAGILSEQGTGWFYKRNLGEGAFAPARRVAPKPSFSGLGSAVQIQDVRGDGTRALVSLDAEPRGFFALAQDGAWEPFRPFTSLPTVDLNNPNARLLDVTGDGLADLLITEDQALVWYPGLGEAGWGASRFVRRTMDEDAGPAVIFADAEQSIHLADMNGDGLADIARARNGELCYWPNLGYGRFGAKVAMGRAPVFDAPDRFDPRWLRLADVDGSGAADALYFGPDGCRVWLNESGNAFSAAPRVIATFPGVDGLAGVQTADLLGTGTVCLVWSSPAPADAPAPVRYIDLMGSRKPHLLTEYRNNSGKIVTLEYAPSTRFYLEDERAGAPWATRLPFPVQVVERVTTRDDVTERELVTSYSYHHGYYDAAEREFRGFGRVDRLDGESFARWVRRDAANVVDERLHQPPVLTRTWYHTGALLDHERLISAYTDEAHPDPPGVRLPDPALPGDLSPEERREAARACKGRVLRQEIYAQDGAPEAGQPYSSAQTTYRIDRVQPRGANRYAVFLVTQAEALTVHDERGTAEPRITHSLTLAVDEFGNVTQAASAAYGRGADDPALPPEVQADQNRRSVLYSVTGYTNDVETDTAYRLRVPCEVRSYELTGVDPAGAIYTRGTLRAAAEAAADLAYEAAPDGSPQRRLVEHTRTLFAGDAGAAALPLGTIQARGLVRQSLRLAFTPGLLAAIYGADVDDARMVEGGYIHSEGDANWWQPSDRVEYGTPFLLAVRQINPFGDVASVTYDADHLLIAARTDFAGNLTQFENDARLLAPVAEIGPNLNVTRIAADELGIVRALAVAGPDGAGLGDTLDDPTARYDYDLARWMTSAQPNVVRTERKERHQAAAPAQITFEYTDGHGQLALTKRQAEPGPARTLDADGQVIEVDTSPALRWVGSGRTVLNNRGSVVKQFEPYFSVTPAYESERALVEVGVSDERLYDPLGRLVRVDLPDGTIERVAFTPWMIARYDRNDTVRESAWYAALGSPDPDADPEPADPAQRAAWLAARHADTPTVEHLDALGRVVYTVADAGAGPIGTRTMLDIEGNQLAVIDARENTVMAYTYSLGGLRARQVSMDGGERRQLPNVARNTFVSWDSRDHRLRLEFDALQRPTHRWLSAGGGADVLVARTIYGDSAEAPADRVARNLLGRVYRVFDQAGLVTNEQYDFKGNLLHTTRRLASDYRDTLGWNVADPLALLDAEVYETRTAYDALNRPVELRTPHHAALPASVIMPAYNEAGLLETVDVRLRGSGAPTRFVSDVDYDARGSRTQIAYGNGAVTTYSYDPLTLRLTELRTTRPQGGGAEDLQRLRYTYDPAGNITTVRDDAQQTVYFNGAAVDPAQRYEYDALYRLTRAEGREHIGQNQPPDPCDTFRRHLPHPGDANALRRYRQQYTYDDVGNLLEIAHSAGNGAFLQQWTQTYTYAADSNRLDEVTVGGATFSYAHDAHGNLSLPHLDLSEWDFDDRLRHVRRGTSEAYFVYDAQGQRVRTVVERGGLREERLYLGGLELFRRTVIASGARRLERETLPIMDDRRMIALVETKTLDADAPGTVPETLHRYQHGNHQLSAALELDDTAAVISYEEYYPYGATSYQAGRTLAEVQRKRYRYTGREQDDVTCLYAMGARYYAPWLGRWTAPDPAGLVDGANLYRYARDNPVRGSDRGGMQTDDDVELGPLRLTDIRLRTDIIPVSGSVQFQNLLSPSRSATGSLTLGARLELDANLRVGADTGRGTDPNDRFPSPREQAERASEPQERGTPVRAEAGAVLRLDTEARRATATGQLFGVVGRVGEGVWGSVLARGQFEAPIPGRIAFSDIGSTLRSSLSQATGDVRFTGAVQAPGFTLGTLSGRAELLEGGQLRLRSELAALNLARLNLSATGQLRESGVDINASGRLTLLGIPSLRLAASGTADFTTGAYRFGGTVAGYIPPLTYATGRFSLTSEEGLSASAHVFGLTYVPGIDIGPDPSPVPPIYRQLYQLPDDPKLPSGPALGYSYFRYSESRLTIFSVGLIPQASGLAVGAHLTIPFSLH